MILDNCIIRGKAGKQQIEISADRIGAIAESNSSSNPGESRIVFDGAIALPGLINSHDHLDFNLYPQLGNRIYNNYREWGDDIHQVNKTIIDTIADIPLALRIEWGKYKNLLNGFTTVVNHGERLHTANDLLSVFENCYSLHSPGFEKNWKWKLNNPLRSYKPFVMHIGEGTDDIARKEIDEVIRSNWFHKKIIAVHGIQMDRLQAAAFAGLVWCPASNYFLTGKTADIKRLKNILPVVLGTDSTLSAPWNAWQHFREGLSGEEIPGTELIDMLTKTPAALWGLNDRGILSPGKRADIVILKNKIDVFSTNPEDILLVMHKGEIKLYDESLASQLSGLLQRSFSRISVNGSAKFVEGDLPALMEKIRSLHPAQEFPVSP